MVNKEQPPKTDDEDFWTRERMEEVSDFLAFDAHEFDALTSDRSLDVNLPRHLVANVLHHCIGQSHWPEVYVEYIRLRKNLDREMGKKNPDAILIAELMPLEATYAAITTQYRSTLAMVGQYQNRYQQTFFNPDNSPNVDKVVELYDATDQYQAYPELQAVEALRTFLPRQAQDVNTAERLVRYFLLDLFGEPATNPLKS